MKSQKQLVFGIFFYKFHIKLIDYKAFGINFV